MSDFASAETIRLKHAQRGLEIQIVTVRANALQLAA
jgi:hypothetical protein